MGHSRDEKTRNHERIVEIASELMREAGTNGPGVAEIMAAAGLTHGGFYKHFASRDDLVEEAVGRAFADSEKAFGEVVEGSSAPLEAVVDWYTSDRHRDDVAHGCAVVALGADAARAPAPVRAAYTAQVERYLHHLAVLIASTTSQEAADPEARKAAVASLSTLVGAVLVARAIDDAQLSTEILNSARDAVLTQSFS